MEHADRTAGALRTGINGAIAAAIGILISGPLGLFIVTAVQPSPPWQDARTYAQHYHPIQTLPFFAGLVMITGFVVMMAAIYQLAAARQKTVALVAVMLTAAFSTLIFFNYITQTTFVPAMARDYRPEYNSILAAFSMANPRSLGWAIEMWGYGFLGVATWLAAPVFGGSRLERATAILMALNGILSVVGALATAYDPGWVLTPPGLISFAAWNVVVFALAICVGLALRRRQARAA